MWRCVIRYKTPVSGKFFRPDRKKPEEIGGKSRLGSCK